MQRLDIRHTALTERDKVLAVQTLTHYLMSGTFGGDWSQFSPNREDVGNYFPMYSSSCTHCMENKGNLELISISIEKVLEKFSDTSHQQDFLISLRQLGGNSDIRIVWLAFFRCLELGWNEYLVSSTLWSIVKGASVPISVANFVSLELEEAILKTLNVTQEYSEGRDYVPARDLRIRQLYRELLDGKVEQVLSQVLEDPDTNFSIWKVLTPKALATGKSDTITLWLSARIESGTLNSRDLTDLFESAISQGRRLTSEESLIVVEHLLLQKNSFSMASAMRYAGAILDVDFGLRVIEKVMTHSWWIQKIILHEISLFLIQIEREELLTNLFESKEILSALDYRTYDYLSSIARLSDIDNASRIARDCTDKIEKFASSNLDLIDLGILFSLIANRANTFSETDSNQIISRLALESTHVNVLASLANPQLEATFSAGIYKLVLIDEVFANAISDVSIALRSRIDEAFALSNLVLLLRGNKSTTETVFPKVSTISNTSLFIGMVRQILENDYVDDLGELAVDAIEILARKGQYLNKFLLENLLLMIVTHGKEDVAKSLITRVFSVVPTHRIQGAFKTALISVAKSNSEVNYGAALREIGSNFGVRVDTTISALIINNELLRGDVFDANTLQGPPSESWNQLAIILDDVVHELNQPIGALANWVGVVRELEHNPDLNREALIKAIVGMEKSLSYLGERMGTYRSLTSGGTDNAWINIEELCFGVAETLADNFNAESISLRKTSTHLRSKWVYGNTFQLRLALRALLMNGIQATLNSQNLREVEVNIYNPPKNLDEVLIQVRDSGPGIPTEIQSRIFDRGFTTKPGRGLGLGLSLTASVVTSMHGQVKLSSSGATGSEFVIRLPSFVAPRHGAPYEEIEIESVDFESELELSAYQDEFEIEGHINE
jgi:signal transduction histidine kinase